ncbi:40S ribosomal S10-like protein, putative [Medicago truncatula]|uniref:40S ribosomal S10-like protein, putative n=1 Tax=Medicago truncatula TaxID=3880 RepID=G7KB63_MEDTR|nr:40S ribosomal S10-like protein, putative [Medicago truncatula]
MADFFTTQVRFNSGNPQMFKVWYINVTLKFFKNQLDEINQGLNPGDTRRVKYIRYERQTLDDEKIMFSWLELKNDDGMHLPTTTIVLPLKLDKVKPIKQQLSSIHPEVLLFLSKIRE